MSLVPVSVFFAVFPWSSWLHPHNDSLYLHQMPSCSHTLGWLVPSPLFCPSNLPLQIKFLMSLKMPPSPSQAAYSQRSGMSSWCSFLYWLPLSFWGPHGTISAVVKKMPPSGHGLTSGILNIFKPAHWMSERMEEEHILTTDIFFFVGYSFKLEAKIL